VLKDLEAFISRARRSTKCRFANRRRELHRCKRNLILIGGTDHAHNAHLAIAIGIRSFADGIQLLAGVATSVRIGSHGVERRDPLP